MKIQFGKLRFLLALAFICGIISCQMNTAAVDDTVHVESVTLDKEKLSLNVGNEYKLTTTILPENATDKSVTWVSGNADIVTVDSGTITAKAEGTVTIIAIAKDGGKSALCTVTVTKDKRIEMPAEIIIVNKQKIKLEAKVIGGTTDKITWKSSDENVTVDSENGLEANFSSISKINVVTVTAVSGELTETCTVKVLSQTFDRDVFFSTCPNALMATSYEIPDGILSIEASTFKGLECLESVKIPDTVTSIGDYAFDNCTSLKHVQIPSGVINIWEHTFDGCTSLKSVEIPSSVTTIGSHAFFCCTSLESVKIPNSVTTIGQYAFQYCTSLKSVEIPSSVTTIGSVAFSGCTSLESINVAANNTQYSSDDGILFSKDKTSLITCPAGKTTAKIPSSVTTIERSAFSRCASLASVEIPSSVTTIRSSAFSGCTSLASVEISSSVTSIESSAFGYCTSLKSVTVKASTPPTISGGLFYAMDTPSIYVPSESVETYKTADGWKKYIDKISAISA